MEDTEAEGRGGFVINNLPVEILQMMFANDWEKCKDVPSIIISMLVCKKWYSAIHFAVLSRLSSKERKKYFMGPSFANGVALAGNIHLLEWGRGLGCPVDFQSVFQAAGEGGHRTMVDWLLRFFARDRPIREPMREIAKGAARGRQKDLLLWAIDMVRGVPEEPSGAVPYVAVMITAQEGAAEKGDKEFLEWLLTEEKSEFHSENVLICAAMCGQLEFLEWLETRCNRTPKSEWIGWETLLRWRGAAAGATRSGQVHILDWTKKKFNPRIIEYLGGLRGNEPGVISLEWLLGQPEYKKDTMECLRFRKMASLARQGAELEFLEWAWNKYKFEVFPSTGSGDGDFLLDAAIHSNRVEIVQWVISKGYKVPQTPDFITKWIDSCHVICLEIFKVLGEECGPVDATQLNDWVILCKLQKLN